MFDLRSPFEHESGIHPLAGFGYKAEDSFIRLELLVGEQAIQGLEDGNRSCVAAFVNGGIVHIIIGLP